MEGHVRYGAEGVMVSNACLGEVSSEVFGIRGSTKAGIGSTCSLRARGVSRVFHFALRGLRVEKGIPAPCWSGYPIAHVASVLLDTMAPYDSNLHPVT